MFPPLLIPVNPNPAKALIQQTAGADPKRMTIAPQAFHRAAPGPNRLGVANFNFDLFQVQTNVQFSAPAPAAGSAVLKASGRTGAATTSFVAPSGDTTIIRYVKTAHQFGGPLRTRVLPQTPIRYWLKPPGAMAPCQYTVFGGADAGCVAIPAPAYPGTLAPTGAPIGFSSTTPGVPAAMSPFLVAASVPKSTGLLAQSASLVKTGTATNMATNFGFPWTTGMVTLANPSAAGSPEVFTLTGIDSRVGGVGTISLVSGALSQRAYSGPNANRGWLRLTVPEPGAAIGALGALVTLAVCHMLVRRRAKRAAAD